MDLIIHNAKIYTVNDNFDIAQAMAISNGKIAAIGSEYEILNKYDATKIIDAKQQVIYPGFIDAHCHFVGYALNLNQVSLVGTKSYDEVIEKVKEFAQHNSKKWVIGRGWDQNDWEVKDYPNKTKLDSLFPDTPVFLIRIDGHAALVNQKALDLAKITSKTKISGGEIILNNNKPTGILIDNAVDLVKNIIPNPTNKEIADALLKAQEKLFKVGLTTIDDAGLTKDTIDLINKLQKENKLKLKIYAMISGTPDMLTYYLKKGPYRTNKLNVCSFKFYMDGALGSHGACLLEPYSDEKNHYGLLITDTNYLKKYAPLIAKNGFQMNTHCIGDSANRLILHIYGEVLKKTNDKRWRIEHAQVIDSSDFELFKKYTIIPSVQPTHATSDMYWAGDRLGEKRLKYAYAYKKLLQQNGLEALGTDFPVEDINPLNTFFAAVFRKDSKNYPKDGFQIENALSREEALRGMTIWAAISNFEENEKGSLEVGKSADFVILNNDLMCAPEKEILNTKIIYTFIDGEIVYAK